MTIHLNILRKSMIGLWGNPRSLRDWRALSVGYGQVLNPVLALPVLVLWFEIAEIYNWCGS